MDKSNEKHAITIQRVLRGWNVRRRLKSDNQYKMRCRRIYSLKEILSSEKTYVKLLSVLFKKIQIPLTLESKRSRKPFISLSQIKCLFGNIEKIYEVHRGFLFSLIEYFKSYKRTLSSLFLEHFPESVQRLYVEYIDHYNLANLLLMKLNENNQFIDFLENCFMNLKISDPDIMLFHLPSYIIIPVQRIPRYVLLLEELQKHTEEQHFDFGDISKALFHMRSVLSLIGSKDKDLNSNNVSLSTSSIPSYMRPTQSSSTKSRNISNNDNYRTGEEKTLENRRNPNSLNPKKPISKNVSNDRRVLLRSNTLSRFPKETSMIIENIEKSKDSPQKEYKYLPDKRKPLPSNTQPIGNRMLVRSYSSALIKSSISSENKYDAH